MNIHSSKILIVFILFLTSCELLVDVDVPMDNANKLVLNGIQQADSSWYVELTRTNHILSPLDDYYFSVSSAVVTIHNPDGTTEILAASGPGIYEGTGKPVPGLKYTVTATAPGVDGVEAEMITPAIIPITKIEWDSSKVPPPPTNPNPGYNWYMSNQVPLKITFNDPPGEKNYYQAEAWGQFRVRRSPPQDENPVYDTMIYPIVMYIRDPAISFEDDLKRRFNDNVFDGSNYTMSFDSYLYSYENQQLIGLEIRLVTISEPLYKYMETLELSDEVSGDPFAQPVQVYSNVSNNFGIFGGVSYDMKKFSIKHP